MTRRSFFLSLVALPAALKAAGSAPSMRLLSEMHSHGGIVKGRRLIWLGDNGQGEAIIPMDTMAKIWNQKHAKSAGVDVFV